MCDKSRPGAGALLPTFLLVNEKRGLFATWTLRPFRRTLVVHRGSSTEVPKYRLIIGEN